MKRHSRRALRCAATFLLCLAALPSSAQTPFVAFESGPVRPMALSPLGTQLFVVNTPDNRLEVFSVTAAGLLHSASIPVGMEPVAVAARSENEAWVVNHLSDSVSIVDVPGGRVTRTLLVGDEPRDIVFAGSGGDRAFITTAHRGQHRTHPSLDPVPNLGSDDGDPQLTTPGVDRADVWVFDATSLGATLGGTPLGVVELFGDTPRALAVSPDKSTVYAAVFHSGNQTAVVPEGAVCDGFGTSRCQGDGTSSPNGINGGRLPGGLPGPSTNADLDQAPETGLVVKFHEASGQWRDDLGRNWSNGIRFFLPDLDVFEIDADTLTPGASHAHVGTILFNMAVNPQTGVLYVSNTEAQNLTRFEGPGVFGGSTVQGNLAHSRITVVASGAVKPRHLNRHIDYGVLPAPAGVGDHSLATPTDMVVSSDGTKLYLAAFGSGKIGVFDTADLENDALWDLSPPEFDPTVESANYLSVSGGGPAGLALDELNDRLYVLTRFDNAVSVVALGSGVELNHIPLHNPEPPEVVLGRHMLYDAAKTSSNGEAACASCHIFGDFDSLAWDLGNPDDEVTNNAQPIRFETLIPFFGGFPDINGTGAVRDFHPMKGPMTTQTLRGLVNAGHMHWRGDRSNGFFGEDNPHSNDSRLSFKNFIVAFEGLVGSEKPPTDPGLQADMELFADFALALTLPPNPVRALDNSLTSAQQAGLDFFDGSTGQLSDGSSVSPGSTGFTCEGCHTLDPAAGHFGTGGDASFENEPQIVKIAHLRNLYQKIGMFGMPDVDFNNSFSGSRTHQGNQVRGTGFLHDGSTDTIFRFLQATVFNNPSLFNEPDVGFDGGDPQRRDVEQFMLAFDSDLAPIVGQQITLAGVGSAETNARISLLIARAGASFTSEILGGAVTECDLVVKGVLAGEARGWAYDAQSALFVSDRAGESHSDAQLRGFAAVAGQEMTYSCAPPGSGERMGIDRDADGELDRDELDAGTDPANPGSVLGACADGIDNDGDGDVDLADAGCAVGAHIENPQCNDGYDNDNDGLVDLGDPQCTVASKNREKKAGRCGLLGVEAFALLALVRRMRRGLRRV